MDQEHNPFNYGTPASGQRFVGRWEQVKDMTRDLTNPQGHSFALIGGRRFGKSSLLEALQDVLLQKLTSVHIVEWYVFPVIVSLNRLQEHSSMGVFAHILHTLYDYFSSPLIRKKLGLTLNFDVNQTQLSTFHDPICSQERFANILEDVIIRFEDMYGSLRLVFLLDETEKIIDQSWTEEIFSQLRSLIYASKVRDYVRCVVAGSSKLIEVREKGSAFLNMLSVIYLEAISDSAIREIVAWADNVQEDFAMAVLQQCGGHPYLAQFLMNRAWESLHRGETPPITALVNRFRVEAHGSLEQWQADLGHAGQVVYQILVDSNSWLTEVQVKQCIQDESLITHIGVALINLCYHGLVQQRGTWYEYHVTGQLFKSWFTDEICSTLYTQTTTPTSDLPISALGGEPTVDVQLPKPNPPSYPTAYYGVMTRDNFPFVSCTIDNTHPECTNARITIEASIQGFSKTSSDTLVVPSGRQEQTSLLPRVSRERVLSLTEADTVDCHVLVKRQFTHNEQILHNKTYEIRLLSRNTALYALQDDQGKLVQDLADYLAVFVTSHQKDVQEFVLEASDEHPDKAFNGYPVEGTNDEEAREILREQAKAFFTALKKRKLRYIFSPNSFGNQANYIAQRVRLPSESLPRAQGQKGQASCLDSTILFASLLESVNIDPLIVLIPGHAFVGWHILRDSQQCDFLETTMIGEITLWGKHNYSFDEALSEGNRKYEEAKRRGDGQRPFLDQQGFLRIVDVAICRCRNINPLA